MYFDLFSRRWVHKPDGVPSGGADASSETTQSGAAKSEISQASSNSAPSSAPVVHITNAAPAGKTYDEEHVSRLREENKKHRLVAEEAMSKLQAADAAKADADKRIALMKLASQAGVSLDVLDDLDLSKFDAADADGTLERLKKYAQPKVSITQAKPGTFMNTGKTETELAAEFFNGRSKAQLFGGK